MSERGRSWQAGESLSEMGSALIEAVNTYIVLSFKIQTPRIAYSLEAAIPLRPASSLENARELRYDISGTEDRHHRPAQNPRPNSHGMALKQKDIPSESLRASPWQRVLYLAAGGRS